MVTPRPSIAANGAGSDSSRKYFSVARPMRPVGGAVGTGVRAVASADVTGVGEAVVVLGAGDATAEQAANATTAIRAMTRMRSMMRPRLGDAVKGRTRSVT